MKILSLQVEQFRKFDEPVRIDGFGDGLNLIAGPNETGKSTLLLALRAALFERHGSKTQAVKDFAPHYVKGARPTVMLDFEVGGERYHLEKRFLKRPEARLETGGGRRFEGSDAEDKLKRLLGLDPSEKTSAGKDSPAHFGVLLTPQARSFQQPDLAEGTRHALEAAIAADIAELGNQSEVDGLLAEFDGMLFEIVDRRGKPKSRYKDVLQRLTDIEREIKTATEERDALRDQLEQLEKAIADRRVLQAAEAEEKLADRLALLEKTRAQAARRQALENRRLEANQRLQAAKTRRASLQTQLQEKERITTEIKMAEKASGEAQERLAMIEGALFESESKRADLDERLQAASRRRRDLEALGRQVERLDQVEATLAALATDVRLEIENEAVERVTLDGEPPASASSFHQVIEGLSIEIEGVGRIGIEPKIEPMRNALAAKAEAKSEIGRFLARLDLDDRGRETMEEAWQAAASGLNELETLRAEIDTDISENRRQAAEAKALLAAASDRRTGLARRLTEIEAAESREPVNPSAFDTDIAEAEAAFDAADRDLRTVLPDQSRVAADETEPDQLDRRIAELRTRIDERRRALENADKQVLVLDSVIAERSGRGLDERIDRLGRQRHLLEDEKEAYARDQEALLLLQSTLREAADEAKATFNAPLSARLAPYISDLLTNTTPVVTPDFSIRAIDRSGVEEPFPQLSDGTREQIAILARLAFADMLQAEGLPALIVLDDALAFSDDHRFERMFAILEKAAARLQVIILTCREDRFAGRKAIRLKIEPAARPTSSAA